MKCTVLLAILLLAVSCSSTPALKESTFVCGELQIAFDETRRAVLDLPGERLVLEPLQKSGVILLYAELLPGVDDERVVTTRMMRFDQTARHLIYLDNLASPTVLIDSLCDVDPSPK